MQNGELLAGWALPLPEGCLCSSIRTSSPCTPSKSIAPRPSQEKTCSPRDTEGRPLQGKEMAGYCLLRFSRKGRGQGLIPRAGPVPREQ